LFYFGARSNDKTDRSDAMGGANGLDAFERFEVGSGFVNEVEKKKQATGSRMRVPVLRVKVKQKIW